MGGLLPLDQIGALWRGGSGINALWHGGVRVWAAPAPAPTRTASTAASTHIHDGHSLTYSYYNSLMMSLLHQVATGQAATTYSQIGRDIPGSSVQARWENATVGDQNTPRYGMANYDHLIFAERGINGANGTASVAVPWTNPEEFLNDMIYNLRYCDVAIADGRANPSVVMLWGIWPGTDMELWPDILEDEHRRHRLRADYLTWKMHQIYPSLPADWRVWVIPGFRLVQKVIDEIGGTWPGPETAWTDFLDDTIHPAAKLEAGLAYLVATCLYQIDLRTRSNPYIFSSRMTNAEADWFMGAAWEIVSRYEPAGAGGKLDAAPEWVFDTHGDYHPGITDVSSLATYTGTGQKIDTVWNGRAGAVPADAVAVLSAQGYTGPAFNVALPAATGNYIDVTGGAVRIATTANFTDAVWQMCLCQVINDSGGAVNSYAGSVGRVDANRYPEHVHGGRGASILFSPAVTDAVCVLSEGQYGGGGYEMAANTRADLTPLQMFITNRAKTNGPIAFWMTPTERAVRRPTGEIVTVPAVTYPTGMNQFRLGPPDAGHTLRIWAWIVMDRVPTVTEMDDMGDWCRAKLVGE